jgi:hypothetical protein
VVRASAFAYKLWCPYCVREESDVCRWGQMRMLNTTVQSSRSWQKRGVDLIAHGRLSLVCFREIVRILAVEGAMENWGCMLPTRRRANQGGRNDG